MRKTIFILGLLLMVVLVVSACAPKTTKTAAQQPAKTVSEPTQAGQEVATPATEPTQETEQPQTATGAPATSSVTQEDLDKLKSGIEGIQPEDLGGLG